MTEFRLYRSATHPEFMREVIVPELAAQGLPEEWAPVVAEFMDTSGQRVGDAIASIAAATTFEPAGVETLRSIGARPVDRPNGTV